MIIPAAVASAAALAARDHVGIIGYRITRSSQLAAGPYHRRDDAVLAVVFQNDRLVSLRVLSDAINGRPASDAEKTALVNQLTGTPPNTFAVPFDARHLSEYRYFVLKNRVTFASLSHDANHADGFFDVGPSGAVTDIQYTPRKLPRFATGGVVREDRAQVLPDFWATVKSRETYDGRFLVFHGQGEFVTVNSDFHRFDSLDAAKAWLQAER